jgi:hypothetical protein
VFGLAMGNRVWYACNAAFDELPIAAYVGKCLACHGGVPGGKWVPADELPPEVKFNPCENIPDLKDLDKKKAETDGSLEALFFWNDIDFDTSRGYTGGTNRGLGFKVGTETEIDIFEVIKYNKVPLRPVVFAKGHQHECGSRICVGRYKDGSPITLTCVIGSHNQNRTRCFGYEIIFPDGTVNYINWDVESPLSQ